MTDTTIVVFAHFGLMLLVVSGIVTLLHRTRAGQAVLAWMERQTWL